MPKKDQGVITGPSITRTVTSPAGGVQMETFIPWKLIKRGVRREIITPLDAPEQFREEAVIEKQERKATQISALLKAIGLAYYWSQLLETGKVSSIEEIAQLEGMHIARARDILRLTLLAPKLVEAVASGTAPATLTLENLLRNRFPADWGEQLSRLS